MKSTIFMLRLLQMKSGYGNKRLSNLNFKTMNSIVKTELVRGLPQMEFTQESLCEACQKGKSKKAPHKSTDTSAIH